MAMTHRLFDHPKHLQVMLEGWTYGMFGAKTHGTQDVHRNFIELCSNEIELVKQL